MAQAYINGYPVAGSTNYASAITCVDKNGEQSTVQAELDTVQDAIDEQNKNLDTYELLGTSSSGDLLTLNNGISNYKMLFFTFTSGGNFWGLNTMCIPVSLFKESNISRMFRLMYTDSVDIYYNSETSIRTSFSKSGYTLYVYGIK